MIRDRKGNLIRIVLHDNRGDIKEVNDIKKLGLLNSGRLDIKPILMDVILRSLKNLDFDSISLLSTIVIKRLMKLEGYRERLVLSKRFEDFNQEYAEIFLKNRRITFPINTPDIFINQKGEIFKIFIKNQYDICEKNVKNKVIVDAGANVGLFSLMCSIFQPKKIYAFEPVNETYKILKDNIKQNGLESRIIPINKALGDRNFSTEINYRMGGDVSASIELKDGYENPQKIEGVRLDDFLKNEKVDFIKIDVEGYEENVLLGAKNIIRRYKPILSFSAYHKPTDKVRLPKCVRDIRSDYEIALHKFAEEIFYCE